MICIRYFRTRQKAEFACELLKKEGFECEVDYDKFLNDPISKYGVPDRFKLMVNDSDYFKIADALAKKVKKK